MKKVIFGDFVEYDCSTSKLGNYHLCNCFVNNGYEVLWVSNAFNQLIYFKDRDDYNFKKSISSAKRHKLADNIYGFAPYSLRLYGNYFLSRSSSIVLKNEKYIIPNIENTLKKIEFMDTDVLWISNPKLYWLTNVVKYKKLVYRMADDYSEFSEFPNIEIVNKKMIEKADCVIITSSTLKSKVQKYGKEPVLLKNGGLFDHFNKANAECPIELKNRNKPKILYIGAIKYWFDVELVAKLADSVDADIYLIGKKEIDLSLIEKKDNVHILGPRKYELLPDYLKHSDVTIIPFIKSEMTDSISPLKLYEYCSAGISVVSTNLTEIVNQKAPIYIGKDHDDFIKGVKQYLNDGYDKTELVKFGKENSWDSRFKYVMSVLNKK